MSSKRWLKSSVKSVSSVRKKIPKNRVSSPVGVTSHITPLPAGEGLGEGPPCALCKKNSSSPYMRLNSERKKHLHTTEQTILKMRGLSIL